MLFFIRLLLRTISLTVLCHFNTPVLDQQDTLTFSIAGVSVDWKLEGQMSMMSLIHGQLIEKRWCKTGIWNIFQRVDVSAHLERLNPHSVWNHKNCTDTTCLAYQMDDKSYRTMPRPLVKPRGVDGLGNLHENALPACQVRRIQQYVAMLCETTQSLKKENEKLVHRCGLSNEVLDLMTMSSIGIV